MKTGKTKTLLIIVLLLLATGVGAGAATWKRSQRENAAASKAATQPTLTRVHALGRIEPQSRIVRLAAPTETNARLRELQVREGQRLAAGDTVAVLDLYPRRKLAADEAEAEVTVARARVAQAKAGAKPGEIAALAAAVNRAQVTLTLAERELARVEPLAARGHVTPSELDQRKADRDRAAQALEESRSNYTALQAGRTEDVAVAEAELNMAIARAARARQEAEDAMLRAPFAGTVLRIHARPGETIGDRGVAEFADVEEMYAVAEVYEADLPRVRLHAAAEVRLSSSNITMSGTVEEIGRIVARKDVLNNDPVSDTDARVVEVRIRLALPTSHPVRSLSNARVEVTIDAAPEASHAR